jgi:hypothetical protein
VLEAHFGRDPTYGFPDFILVFTGLAVKLLIVLIEAKLWSEESGTGDFDQIARFLRLVDQPFAVNPKLPESFTSALDEAYLDVTENKSGLATATRVARDSRANPPGIESDSLSRRSTEQISGQDRF